MAGRVAGKTALITGAAGGLGIAIGWALAREGARVMLTDLDGERVQSLAAAIDREIGEGTAFARAQDVTSDEKWAETIAATEASLGGLSVLVNNAGIATVGTVEDLSLETWRRDMAVNVDSVFLGVKHAMPLLRRSTPASIITMSSVSGLVAAHNFASYNTSKAAVWMLSKSIALHCARQKWDIRANTIHPAFVRTPILDGLVGTQDQDVIEAKLARQVPIGRIGEPAEIADAVLYLASDESRFMTGAELKLDGGISAM